MENIMKLMQSAFHVIVLFLGIMTLYQMNNHYKDLVDIATVNITGDNMVSVATPINKSCYITKGELMVYLTDELNYDLEIIDQFHRYSIDRESYSPASIGLYSFTGELYEKNYHYKLNGEISKIIFRYCENN